MSFTSSETRWADVYLVAGARGVSVCGDFLTATTLALVLQQAGHGGFAVSGLMLAASLPLVLVAPLAGRLADRADSRTVLATTGLVQSLICLVLAFAEHPAPIIGLVALLACGLAITQPTQAALLPEMAAPGDLARASGLSQTASTIGMLAAPALAGILVGQVGARVPLLINAATYLALVAVAFLIRTRRRGAGAAASRTRVAWRLRDDRTLTLMVGALAACIAGVGAINVVEVFFIRETLGASTTMFGFVAASWTGGMLIGTLLFARIRRERMTVPLLLLIVAGSCLPVLVGSTVGSAAWLVPLWIAGGVCNGGINVLLMVIVASRTPSEAHGRAYAAVGAAIQGAGVVGLLAAGPLVEHFDPRALVAAAGGTGLLVALACLPITARISGGPRRPGPAARSSCTDGTSAAAAGPVPDRTREPAP